MVVYWTEERIKVIPAEHNDGMVVLAPGYMDVPDESWVKARTVVKDDIASGRIIEEMKKISADQRNDFAFSYQDEKGQWLAPAKFVEISRARIKNIIEETYHVPTLNKWLDEEVRQDVRLMLMKRLSEVDKNNAEEYKIKLAATMEKVG